METQTEQGLVLISGGHTAPGDKRFNYQAVRTVTWKSTPQAELEMTMQLPHDIKPGDRRAAVVFFFGGGFVAGTRHQFNRQCAFLASRGMVAFTADYRVKRIHGTSLGECVEDTTDAYRWLCDHADELSIDPERIAVGGGSAGATLAAVLGVDGVVTAHRPGALLLFNPAFYSGKEELAGAAERFGFRTEEMGAIDVASRLGASLPPSWLWYGDQDRLYHQGKPVIEAMRRSTPRLELLVAEGADHGYFNDYEKYYRESIESLDRFLTSIGYVG